LINSESIRGNDGRFLKGFRHSKKTEFKKGQHWRPHSRIRDKEYLTKEYINHQKSTSEIGKENGVTDSAVIYWLKKHNIKRRNISEAREIKHWVLKGKQNGMYGRCGSLNPRWIDGSSPERQKYYARSFWKELVKWVYQRDGYKCQRCGSPHTKNNRLHAHHIKPWAGNKDFRFDTKNIITICKPCHNWIHSKKNIKNEFILH